MAARGQRGKNSRTGTVFVLIGLFAILGVTFGAGVYTGRHFSRPAPVVAKVDGLDGAGRRDGRGLDRGRAQDAPSLTFYQELTAPLTAPPPAAKPAKPPKPADTIVIPSRPAVAEPAPAPAPVPAPSTPRTPAPAGESAYPTRYTVQVGAYRAKAPADALRATLAAAGHDAHVVESEAPAGARYRVRVGAFSTREAARAAAARLSGERTLSPFVTAVDPR